MNYTAIVGALMAVAAIVMVIVQILKLTPLPTEQPKAIAFIIALALVGVAFYADGKFTTANAAAIAASVGTVSVSAYGLYEVTKTAYRAFRVIIGWLLPSKNELLSKQKK